MTPSTTVPWLLAGAAARLRAAGVASPEVDARQLLAHVTGWRVGEIGRHDTVPPSDHESFDRLVSRRAAREPLQHLTGRVGFRYVELVVGPGVFVPRPETEVMTGWVVDRLRDLIGNAPPSAPGPRVVELGTGSGAIAKALATEVSTARIEAVELSEDAAAWARRNLVGTGVCLHLSDMADALPELDQTVDLVVANPPYVPLDSYASLPPEARDHDPAMALFAGPDGLDAVRTVARVAARLLRSGGSLAVEHADVQGDSVPRVLLDADAWDTVRDHQDLTGRPRFTTAVRRGTVARRVASANPKPRRATT